MDIWTGLFIDTRSKEKLQEHELNFIGETRRLVFNNPKVIDNQSILIVGYLLHVQMTAIGDKQSGISVIVAAESGPWRHLWNKFIPFFTAALK